MLVLSAKGFAQVGVYENTESETNYFDSITERENSFVEARAVPDTVLHQLKADEDYWYADGAPLQKKKDQETAEEKNFMDQSWFSTLMWIIIIAGFVAGLVWYLASSNISLFRRKPIPIQTAEDELITEDIFELRYEDEISKAIAAENYRLAIRLMYLQTLKDLADREIIQYKQERTNTDYLLQLSGSGYYKDFFRLTRDFEYTWYGKFQLSPVAFEIVRKDFSSFKQQLQ